METELEPHPDIPSPAGHGWNIDGDVLSIDWMSVPPAPDALLK